MLKLIFLPFVLFLSCVSEHSEKASNSVGQGRDERAVTNLEDNERVAAVCKALANKENVLDVLVSARTEYTFSFSQKGCNEASLPVASDIKVKMARSGDEYIFRPVSNEVDFGFQDVEIFSSGAMAEICGFAGTLESPILTPPNGALCCTTFTPSEHCQAGFGSNCVQLSRGTWNGQRYILHTEEWIKFKIYNDKEGLFIERKLISSAGCQGKRTFEMKAILK